MELANNNIRIIVNFYFSISPTFLTFFSNLDFKLPHLPPHLPVMMTELMRFSRKPDGKRQGEGKRVDGWMGGGGTLIVLNLILSLSWLLCLFFRTIVTWIASNFFLSLFLSFFLFSIPIQFIHSFNRLIGWFIQQIWCKHNNLLVGWLVGWKIKRKKGENGKK